MRLCRQVEISVILSDKMILSKLMLIDDETVILGAANTSVFSMPKAVELDIVVQDNSRGIDLVRKTIDLCEIHDHEVQLLDELGNDKKLVASRQQIHQLLN